MRKIADFHDAMDTSLSQGANHRLMYRTLEDQHLDGRIVRLDDQELVNFSSCSYLGLETNDLLKEGAIDAIRRFGTQFSSSRGYLSVPLYEELEELLEEVFGMPALIVPTTTLGHAAALPILVEENDAVILDQQVHASVQQAMNHVRVLGTPCEINRHSRMDELEQRIRSLRHHRKVWYMADGLYSMYGDLAPVEELSKLLELHENLHLYVDDAHAMSWCGPRGMGYATQHLLSHSRVVVATSLNKAFAAGGGVLLVPCPELRRKIRTIGSAFTFSGPLQPANLGAAVASARLHASGAVHALQEELQQRIRLCNQLCEYYGIPLYSPAEVPIRFVAAGLTRAVFATVAGLKDDGFYTNCAIFPAVPMTRAGIRFTLTLNQRPDDIERMLASLAQHLPRALKAEGSSIEEVRDAFQLSSLVSGHHPYIAPLNEELRLTHTRTISELDENEWDRLLGDNGTFSAAGLRYLERTFSDSTVPEERWDFHYYVIRDKSGKAVLATFFTSTIWKDDMLADATISAEVEDRRKSDPYFLTSKTLGMGSLLTEGQHLYLDRAANWQEAMRLLLREVERERERSEAVAVALRDISCDDDELDAFLVDEGYVRIRMPESAEMNLGWSSEAEYMARLSTKSRLHQRKKVLPFEDSFEAEVIDVDGRKLAQAEYAHLHELYRAVKERNLAFNCFELPEQLFPNMAKQSCWELVLLYLRPEHGTCHERRPVAAMACFRGTNQYAPMVCGLDYRYVHSHGAYRVLLRTVIQRANTLGYQRLYFGIGATHEKTRYGASPRRNHAYVQHANHFNLEVLHELMLRPSS